MIEDVVARHVVGREPFHIEATWRDVYAAGYGGRPDPTLAGVLSGIEMAMWDIAGKAVGKPVYELLGGRVRERLRTYSYLYARPGDATDVYTDPGARGDARGGVRGARLHGAQVRSGRAVRVVRPAPALARRSRSLRALRRGRSARPSARAATCCSARTGSSPSRARSAWRAGSSASIRSGSRSRRRPSRPRRWRRSRARRPSRSRRASA